MLAPIAWLIGVDSQDMIKVAALLGTKVVFNEFVAYSKLGDLKAAGAPSPKSLYLATFALCGSANFSSFGIQLGARSPP